MSHRSFRLASAAVLLDCGERAGRLRSRRRHLTPR